VDDLCQMSLVPVPQLLLDPLYKCQCTVMQMSVYCHVLLHVQALKKHISTVHCGPGAVSHACSSCSMTFNNRGNLLRHFLRIHRGLRRFICGLCGARYGQNQDLRRHLKAKHHVDMPVISGVDKKAVSEVKLPEAKLVVAQQAPCVCDTCVQQSVHVIGMFCYSFGFTNSVVLQRVYNSVNL
jgi:hypothetical protein